MQQQQRPKTAQLHVDTGDKREELTPTLDLHQLVTLKLTANPRLQSIFPNDPHSDVTINFHNKKYNLQRAHLRLETDYFDGRAQQFHVKEPLPFQSFENILHCLYGSVYCIKKQAELYNAYHVCKQLRIESLVRQMDTAIVANFEQFNFFIVFQLGEVYHNEDLRQICLEYLESNNEAYLTLLDLNQAKCNLIKTKQLFSQPKDIEAQPPVNLLLLNEGCFKNLIQLHNSYKIVKESQKQNFLPYVNIYQLIKLYVECRVPAVEEPDLHKQIVRALVLDLFDKKTLNSREYRIIYHSELLLPGTESLQFSMVQDEPHVQSLNNTVVKNTRTFGQTTVQEESQPFTMNTLSNFTMPNQKKALVAQAFDPIVSQNYLTKIEVHELKEENAQLLGEVQKLRISLEQSVQHDYKLSNMDNNFKQQMGLMQSHFTQLDIRLEERIGGLQEDLKEVKVELQEKKLLVIQREHTIRKLQEQVLQLQKRDNNSSLDFNDREVEEEVEDLGESNFVMNELQESESRVMTESQVNRGMESVNLRESGVDFMNQTTQSQYMQDNDAIIQKLDDSTYVTSDINIIQSQVRSVMKNNSIMSMQITQQQRFIFDYDPVTIDDPSQLNFLCEHLDISIFQRAELQQIYIGSRDGYRSDDFIRQCGGHEQVLVLVKSWDYDKNFGVYITRAVINTDDQFIDSEGFMFSVSHGFIAPYKRIKMGDERLFEIDDLVLGTNCTDELSCRCQYPRVLAPHKHFNRTHVSGAEQFSVDEIEAFRLVVTQAMN